MATVVIEDSVRNDGSGYCNMFFEIADGNALVFFEHTSLVHPKNFNTRGGCHPHVAFEVEGDAMVQQVKHKLDAAGIPNTLMNPGASLSLRFNDPNGLMLEFMAGVRRSSEYGRTSRASAHSELQRWLRHRQSWWRNASAMK